MENINRIIILSVKIVGYWCLTDFFGEMISDKYE